jgi:hypothetical protein
MSLVPLHVLMTTDAVGGVWTYALDLAEGLSARGVRITLAVSGPAPRPAQRRAAEQIGGLTLVEAGGTLDWLADGPRPLDQTARQAAAARRRRIAAQRGNVLAQEMKNNANRVAKSTIQALLAGDLDLLVDDAKFGQQSCRRLVHRRDDAGHRDRIAAGWRKHKLLGPVAPMACQGLC